MTTLIRAEIATVVVANGPLPSVLILRPRDTKRSSESLPIRIGTTEAISLGMGIDPSKQPRPMTHDFLKNTISALGALVKRIEITDVVNTTFFAKVLLMTADGQEATVDARPSDAVSLAIRTKAPIFVEERVMNIAGYPDFETAKREAQKANVEEFDKFVENITPGDFTELS